jgi:hypothetical protein
LGDEGTFVYDTVTGQWAQFSTEGFTQWNVSNGVMWGQRIVGGSLDTADVWEVSADQRTDNGAAELDIAHAATGGIQTRSRNKLSVGALRVTGSPGELGRAAGTSLDLAYSDDNGNSYSALISADLTQGEHSTEMAYRSLGSFAAPGRVFAISDVGGPQRIDGADVEIPELDNARSAG